MNTHARTGNVIGGHLRIEEELSRGDQEPVPFVLGDLSIEEEQFVLASLNPLTAMAATDKVRLDSPVARCIDR